MNFEELTKLTAIKITIRMAGLIGIILTILWLSLKWRIKICCHEKNKFLTIISYLYEQYMMNVESHKKKKVEEREKDNEKSIDLGLDWDDD